MGAWACSASITLRKRGHYDQEARAAPRWCSADPAGFRAFRADCGGGRSFVSDSAVAPAAGSVLGAHYDAGHHAVIAGCGPHCFLAAFRRDGAWSGRWRDRGESLWATGACIRCLRIHPRTALRPGAPGPNRISVRGRYAGDCVVGAADGGPCMAHSLSSVRRGVHRNWGGAGIGVVVAGARSHAIGVRPIVFLREPHGVRYPGVRALLKRSRHPNSDRGPH